MSGVAVIAHAGKVLGGGLPELRATLVAHGVDEPDWHEVTRSRHAPKAIHKALAGGSRLLLIWGGDGMVQRCIDAVGSADVVLAIIPAGTANLLATNLGVPTTIAGAVAAAIDGGRRTIDVGTINGERFAVMAGAGFDAQMIRDADGGLKDRAGRLAYIVTGARNLSTPRFRTRVTVDGVPWFKGKASCVLVGNVGKLFAGVEAFADSRIDDGRLDLAVVTAEGAIQWARTIARAAIGTASDSPFASVTSGTAFDVRFKSKVRFEIDGGSRERVRRLEIRVERAAVTFAVPAAP
jgi:diacylglycerol kinase family enzyme